MAHRAKLFTLPAGFEFATQKGQWFPSSAVVLDWWRSESGEIDDDAVRMAIQNGPRAGQPFRRRIEELTQEMFDICAEAQQGDDIGSLCSGLEQAVLINTAESTKTQLGDAWSMRRDFLEKARSEQGVIEFLNTWGSWTSGSVEIAGNVIYARSELAAAMTERPEKWLRSHASHLPMLSRINEYPYFVVTANRCAVAVRVATTIDFLNGLKFRVCARPDCATPFAIESKHRKKYCQWYCAHLESMRRNRRKEKRKSF